MVRWFFRKAFWDLLGWVKMAANKPLVIPAPPLNGPPVTGRPTRPVPLADACPAIPILGIAVCPPDEIPADEKSWKHSLFYVVQLWLYKVYSPMQPDLPPINSHPARALKKAYTWLHRTKFPPPDMPAEFLGSPDLGSLAVRGPYSCYLEKEIDGDYVWDLESLSDYEHHPGLLKIGVKVNFRYDALTRSLKAYQIRSVLGTVGPESPEWERSKRLALCAVSTHLTLIRHFNWVHLAAGAHFAIATRNHLPAEHALTRLLWPFMYGTAQSNDIVTKAQMVKGGDFESIFSFSFKGMCQLFNDSYKLHRFVVNDPEEDRRTRRLTRVEFEMPTQDNLVDLFEAFHGLAIDYLKIVYPGDDPDARSAEIGADTDVMAWLDELNDLVPNGVDINRDNVTFTGLTRLVARLMYLATVQHEILGGFLWNYQLWTHRQPARMYLCDKREPLDVYQRLVNANYNLNVNRRALMYDFTYLAVDDPTRKALADFQKKLHGLQLSMTQEPWAIWKLYPSALKVNINA